MQTAFWNPKQRKQGNISYKNRCYKIARKKNLSWFLQLSYPLHGMGGASLPHLQCGLVLSIILNPRKDKAL